MPLSYPYRIDTTGRTATPADEAAHVRELIEQVLFTKPGERVMQPSFGSGVHQLVFAPASDELAAVAGHLIRGALTQWLAKWIEVADVKVQSDDAQLAVTVVYTLRRTGAREVATFHRS